MVDEIKTGDGNLEIEVLEWGFRIKSPLFENVGIEIDRVDPSNVNHPVDNALLQIRGYNPKEGEAPFEYGIAYVKGNGEIVSREPSYLKKNR